MMKGRKKRRGAAQPGRARPREPRAANASLLDFLSSHRERLIDRVTRALEVSGTAYSQIPARELRQAVEYVVIQGIFEAARSGREHLRHFLSDLGSLRYEEGFPLPHIEQALSILRGELLGLLLEERPEPSTLITWLVELWDVVDCGRLGLAEAYDRLRQENSRDLERKVLKRTSELAASHERLRQAEKLSALGKLISGVAHELNNPLTGILGFSQLLLGADLDERIARQLKHIHEQGLRCQKIVKSLLAFSRRQRPEMKPVGLNGIVESCLQLQEYSLRANNIRVEKSLEADLPMILGDFHQLQQVIMNLITNACQAMVSGRGRGALSISTRRTESGILLSMEDDGPGIPPQHLPWIFDPFFTTKPPGEGTGLGLSICYGIVQEHGGVIRACCPAGRGARFTVQLPAHAVQRGAEGAGAGADAAAVSTARSVLVVDDELSILDLLYDALRSWGHRVDTAVNGEAGLRKALHGSYDLILCDYKMPGFMGSDLYRRLREADPGKVARIVFFTGDLLDPDTRSFFRREQVEYLEKPLDLMALREFMNRWFDRAALPAAAEETRAAY